jgi:hypothetical protein
MDIKSVTIHFENNNQPNEYAFISVNDDENKDNPIWLNGKGKLSKDSKAAIYAKVVEGVDRSCMYRCALIVGKIKRGEIEFDL